MAGLRLLRLMYGVANDPSKIQCLPTLEDRCFYYIIHHLSEFPPGTLYLLPLHIRERLLLNLPAVVPCVLGVEGLTISELNYQPEKYKLRHMTQNNPGALAVPLHHQHHNRILKKQHWYHNRIPKKQYWHHNRILKKQRVFIATIRYFDEVCRILPKHYCFHCVSIGEQLQIEQSSSFLQSFMANLEVVRLDGRGPLNSLEEFHRETQHERFKRLFLCIPKMFLGAAIANPRCNLKSIEIDADDSQRASSLLVGVQSALSIGYTKVELFSLKFHHVYTRGNHPDLDSWEAKANPDHCLTYHLLSDIKQLVDAQLQLRSIEVSLPKKIPSTGEDMDIQLSSEGYTKFIIAIRKYVQRPNFECLILRNLLTIETAQQIIHTFLSLPLSSDPQLLDIRTPDDVTPQSDTIPEGPGKSLKISGTVKDDHDKQLIPLVFQMLCNASVHDFEVVDNISGIISALKQPVESLPVKGLCLTIHKRVHKKIASSIETFRGQVRSLGIRMPHQGYHRISDRKQHKEAEFPEIPRVDKIIGNPSLLSLRIKFLTNEDCVSHSNVSSLLSTVSNGLQLQSCKLRSLTLPKFDHPLDNDDDLQHFFSCIFSLPHVDEFEINLSFVKFSLRCAQTIHSCHSESGEKVLAKFVLHYDSFVGCESSELLKALLSDICKELFVAVSNQVN